jgi:TonB-linked SusC/RagA family outer membrane protein
MKKNLLILLFLNFIAFSGAFAQSRKITGTVTSADDGQPLPGVTVVVTNTTTGVQTDAQGHFTVNVPTNGTSLTFRFVGFQPQTVAISNRSTVDVILTSDLRVMNEVVVTGYTSTTREKSTGATSTVSAKTINNVPTGSIDQILQGQVPGLQILAGSGQPGSSATARIRGASSISGGTTPLYVIDGIPVESGVFQTLNPNDFENVTVLKDASATSLYGSRGSNGVIVITTKRGKAGKTVFSYDGQAGVSIRTRAKFDMMSSSEILAMQQYVGAGPGYTLSPSNTANVNVSKGGKTYTLTAAQKAHDLDSLRSINTDWDDLFLRTGKFQSHQVSASGGSEKTRFYSSLSYYGQDGIAARSRLDRYNLRLNLDHQSGNFKFGVQSGIGWSKSSFIESEAGVALANPFAAAYLGQPYENPYAPDGSIITSNWAGRAVFPFPIYDSRTAANALARIDQTNQKNNQIKENIAFNASYEVFKGLSIKTNLGLDFRETNNENTVYPNTYAGSVVSNGGQGSYFNANGRNLQLIQTSGVEYNGNFGKHEVFATALAENVRNRFSNFSYTGFGINPKLLNTPAGITPGTNTNGMIPTVGGSKTQSGINSLIGIARYTYDDKYTFQGSIRRDGSSQVAEINRYHTFYSLGVNWNAKRESFMENVSFVDVLRLRASYGTTANGNGFSSDFGYLPTFGSISYAGTAGIAPTFPGNPDFDWEYAKKFDLGLEFAVLKNRVRSTIDYYNNDTYNLFVSQQLSRTSGFTSLNVNAGTMRNRGVEISLQGDIISSKDWLVTLYGNYAYNKNTITSLGQVNEFESGTSIIRVGLPLGSHYAVKSAGVDPQTGNYLYYNRDGSTTTTYNSSTQNVAEFGTSIPPKTGGFGLNASYKGVSLTSLFSFAYGYQRFNNERYFLTNPSFASSYNQLTIVNTIWRQPGDVTTIGRAASARQFNSTDIEDASFLRLRNVTLGYNFPKSIIGSKYIKGLRIYAQGTNLYTWTKWSAFDPEDSNNLASFEYPAARTITFGANVTF